MPRNTEPAGMVGAAQHLVMAQLVQRSEHVSQAQAEAEVAVKMRDDVIRQARRLGVSFGVIASLSGLSKARVHQIDPGPGDIELEDEDGTLDQAEAI